MDECNDVLVRETTFTTWNDLEQQSLLDILDQRMYSQLQTAGNGGLSIFGVNLNGSYENFDQQRIARFQQINFQRNTQRSGTILQSKVGDKAIDAWLGCKRLNAERQGLSASIVQITANEVIVAVTWNPAPGLQTAVVSGSFVSGAAAAVGLPANVAIADGTQLYRGTRTLNFVRVPGASFLMSINIDINGGVYTAVVQSSGTYLQRVQLTCYGNTQHVVILLDNAVFRLDEEGYQVTGVQDLDSNVVRLCRFYNKSRTFQIYYGDPLQDRTVIVHLLVYCRSNSISGNIMVREGGQATIQVNGGQVQNYRANGNTTPFTWNI